MRKKSTSPKGPRPRKIRDLSSPAMARATKGGVAVETLTIAHEGFLSEPPSGAGKVQRVAVAIPCER